MATVVQEKLFVIVTSAERRGHKQYVTILKLVDNVFLPACGQERKELWVKFRESKTIDAEEFLSWLDEAEEELKSERRKDDQTDKRFWQQ